MKTKHKGLVFTMIQIAAKSGGMMEKGVSYTGSSLYHADSSWTDWLNVKQAVTVFDLLVAGASSVLPSFIYLTGSGLASS